MQAASTEFMWPTAWIRHPRVALPLDVALPCLGSLGSSGAPVKGATDAGERKYWIDSPTKTTRDCFLRSRASWNLGAVASWRRAGHQG